MDSVHGRAVSLIVPVAAALIAIEFAVDRAPGARFQRFADAIANLSCGIVSTGTRVFLAWS